MASMPSRFTYWFFYVVVQLILPSTIVSLHYTVDSLPGYPGKLPFKLETGYISVGDLDEVELFYYFIESTTNPSKDPLLLWLNGGPGCSAFSGLVYEIGPLTFDYATFDGSLPSFVLNNYSWTNVASIIFVDAPVGTGFSYSTTQEGYETSDTKSANSIYQFMRKWLVAHPSYAYNPLYIAGDSYSGMIVPLVTQLLSEDGPKPVGLQGYILGNPAANLVEDENSRMEFYHRLSLISDELYESVKSSCNGEYVHPNVSNLECMHNLSIVTQCVEHVNTVHILEPKCDTDTSKLATSLQSLLEDPPLEILQLPLQNPPELWCRGQQYVLSNIWANDENVREALHVRNGTKPDWKRCNNTLSYDSDVRTVVPLHLNLSKKGYRALIYSGDHDVLFPYVGTKRWIDSLNMTVSRSWRPWFVSGQVAGYTVKYEQLASSGGDGLTYATVKGGGHTAPEYKPVECLKMIHRWLGYYSL